MAKQSLIQRSLKKFKLSKSFSEKRNTFLKQRTTQNILLNFKIQKGIQSVPKNSSLIRFKRFCWKTGRTRGYFRDFALSRHIIREMAHNALFPGLTKSSW